MLLVVDKKTYLAQTTIYEVVWALFMLMYDGMVVVVDGSLSVDNNC